MGPGRRDCKRTKLGAMTDPVKDAARGNLSSLPSRWSKGPPEPQMTHDSQSLSRTHSVILRLGDRFCSLPVDCVREMTVLPEIRRLCGTAPYVLGVITLRGEAIPVVDLRMRLGLRDTQEGCRELVALLKDHEKEHVDGLDELETCVRADRPFPSEPDPNACPFGLWMAAFRPQTRELAVLVQGFSRSHKAFHGIAKRVMELVDLGRKDEALCVLQEFRATELNSMRLQFKRVYNLLSAPPRLIVTVIEVEGEQVGLIVDEVASLAWVRSEAGDISREAALIDGLFASMGRNESTNAMVSMLNPHGLRVHAA